MYTYVAAALLVGAPQRPVGALGVLDGLGAVGGVGAVVVGAQGQEAWDPRPRTDRHAPDVLVVVVGGLGRRAGREARDGGGGGPEQGLGGGEG